MINQIEITKTESTRILRELQTTKCFCGSKKPVGASFCPTHFYSLPKPLLSSLRQSVGDVYVGAYLAAREWFEANS